MVALAVVLVVLDVPLVRRPANVGAVVFFVAVLTGFRVAVGNEGFGGSVEAA